MSLFLLKIFWQNSCNDNNLTLKMKDVKIKVGNRNMLSAINCFGVASYSIPDTL